MIRIRVGAAEIYFTEKDATAAACGDLLAWTVVVKQEEAVTPRQPKSDPATPLIGDTYPVDLDDENDASVREPGVSADSLTLAPVVEGDCPDPAIAMVTVTPDILSRPQRDP